MRAHATAALVLFGLVLAGCGDTRGQRALSGGALGAGVGALGGAIVGGSPLTGAVVGGATGAVVGAVTSRRDIDLGRTFD